MTRTIYIKVRTQADRILLCPACPISARICAAHKTESIKDEHLQKLTALGYTVLEIEGDADRLTAI
jgi:hypothetical protein